MADLIAETGSELATLVHLGRRAREAGSLVELRFVAVNETHALTPYRQAALWFCGDSPAGGRLAALSGVATIEGNAPYVMWLTQLFKATASQGDEPVQLLQPDALAPDLVAQWAEWLPADVVLVRLPPIARFNGALLLLARDQTWSQVDLALLADWGAMLGQAFGLHGPASFWSRVGLSGRARTSSPWHAPGGGFATGFRHWLARRSLTQLGLILTFAAAMIPVHTTVLAPAELVPLSPSVIRAPMDGIVDKVLVRPNQTIKAGEALLEFDRISLESRLQVAASALATSQAEYRNRAQRALFDAESKAQLAVIQGQIEEKRAEVEYLRSLAGRALVTAPRDGVVLFGDATEWVGRPVATGERVMVVADPSLAEIEAWLSPGDAVPLAIGSSVLLYLNADPTAPLKARLRYVAHEAIARPDGNYAYRVRAELMPGERGRVGLKGSAKLTGERALLGYWILRRPLAQARAWIGW